jgi:hypothetical protein
MKRKVKLPETSIIAGQNKSDESKQRDYEEILRALSSLGSGTYEDVSLFLGWEELNKSARRFKEMREKGMIENTGIKKLTTRNRPAFIHQLKSKPQSTSQIVDTIIHQATKPDFIQKELFT